MKKVLLATIAMLSLVAMPAFAAVQNIKVGGNIDTTFIHRGNFDLGSDAQNNNQDDWKQDLFITQTQVRVDADLSDNVRTTVQIINERPWQEENNDVQNDIDINLAFVEMREMLDSHVTVDLGRQQFNYGNAFIIGANGPNNTTAAGGLNNVAEDLTKRTAYDGVKFVFDYNPLTIDVFAAKTDANNLLGTGRQKDDQDLLGLNANYNLNDEMNTTLEAYLFSRIDRTLNSTAGAKTDTVYVPGLRASTNPVKGLNMQIEGALQRGNKTLGVGDNIRREAFGGQFVMNYQLPVDQMAPVLQAVYTYVSGDSNPTDATYAHQASSNKWEAWDQMFEDQGSGTIYNTMFNLSNAHIGTVSGQITPIEDVTAKLSYTGLWLAKEVDTSGVGNTSIAILNPDGSTPTERVTSNKEIGSEIDADLTYNYTEDVQFGLSLGYFKPGNLFDDSNKEAAKQALANASVNF